MNNNSVTIKFDLRIVCVVLLIIIIGMLAVWRPWSQNSGTDRKITIAGTATVSDTPDQYVFYPSFTRTGTDLAKLKADLNSYGTTLQADLIKLGIAEKDIKLDSSSYDYTPASYNDGNTDSQTVSLNVTITAHTKDMAQKVQDYLAKTDATGQLTAQAQFSTAKQKQLDEKARLLAIADARKKAGVTATNVDAKLGKVLTVSDDTSGGGIIAYATDALASGSTKSSLPVTPGTSEVTASVKVTFQLR